MKYIHLNFKIDCTSTNEDCYHMVTGCYKKEVVFYYLIPKHDNEVKLLDALLYAFRNKQISYRYDHTWYRIRFTSQNKYEYRTLREAIDSKFHHLFKIRLNN